MTMVFQPSPDMPPPASQTGLLHWVRNNLFNSFANGLLTIIGLAILANIIPPLVNWVLLDAIFQGTAETCRQGQGAWLAVVDAQIKR